MATRSSIQVLGIPELVALLARDLDKRDLIHLAYTSRGCFLSAINHVWREIRGVHNLLALIPGTKCEDYGGKGLNWACTIPDLWAVDLTRFRFYAPFIQHLEILPRPRASYLATDWSNLHTYARSTTLLPNLRTLIFGAQILGESSLSDSLKPFLTPGVRQIHTNPPGALDRTPIPIPIAAALLEAIFQTCPDVTDLTFLPEEVPHDIDASYSDDNIVDGQVDPGSDTTTTEIPLENLVLTRNRIQHPSQNSSDVNDLTTRLSRLNFRPATYYKYLRHADCLHTLTTSACILRPGALMTIGELPNLKTINVHFCVNYRALSLFDYSKLPTSLFSSLRTLRLHLPEVDDIRQIWKIKPLVSRLRELAIDLHDQADFGTDHIHSNYFLSLFPTICAQSSSIESLTLDFNGNRGGSRIFNIPLQTLVVLASLPLKTLDLRGARLGTVKQACQSLSQCCTLRNLYIASQRIDYDELLYFSQIPGLECLYADFLWEDKRKLSHHLNNSPPEHSSNIQFLWCSTFPELTGSPKANLNLTKGVVMYAFFNQSAIVRYLTQTSSRWLSILFPKLEEVSYLAKQSGSADSRGINWIYDFFKYYAWQP
ncbi:hypothetical protein FRC12_001678 [Ceratobasidium sp. 428]|nr:hypothetical protein FRC12_001678 [Ceratobasidium sp. 428]